MSKGLFIRITPHSEGVTLEEMEEFVEQDLRSSKYVISLEHATNDHFHLLVYTPMSPENVRYRIKQNYDCNVYISGKEIQDKIKAIAYTIKDGHYVHKGLDIWEWMQAKQMTYPKVKFDEAIKVIKQNYSATFYEEGLVRELIQLHIDTGRRIYRQHLRAWIDTIKLEVDERYRERLVKEILLDI